MDLTRFRQLSDTSWELPPEGGMRVPGVIFATRALLEAMDAKVAEQTSHVASLPGIVKAAYAMPDAHWGYGFPIGGVAAFDPDQGGVISAGGVGFDISCGVRTLTTGLTTRDLEGSLPRLADTLFARVPAGVGSTGKIRLTMTEMDAMLAGGAAWAVKQGYGQADDLERIEEGGRMAGARPEAVSDKAKKRQKGEMGTLGSGNHYLELQAVDEIFDRETADAFGLYPDAVLVSIHCGSRGLGHQIGTEFLREMAIAAHEYGIHLPDRELACAPLNSPLGERYLGAMRAGINCALANRQIITHLAREAFALVLPQADLRVLYDVSHNTCKLESHRLNGESRELFVHRKGATRALEPGSPDLPAALRAAGQPVFIGGSMGTASFILAGMAGSERVAFASACHGAGRAMSRHQATRRWRGEDLVESLAGRGILIRSHSYRGVAEEAPEAYKDVRVVVDSAEQAGLARKVASLRPLATVKG